jgi:hypothetical protein
MPAEHDHTAEDEVLQHVIAELRRPVPLDPALEQRVLAQIRAEGPVPAPTGAAPPWWAWVAGAAVAAGLLVTVVQTDTPSTASAGPGAAEAPAVPPNARPVRLRLAAPASSRVVVVGDFNDWDPAATPLRPIGDGDTWVVELRLEPGRYHYTFLIDGRRWARDPSEPRAAESDFGAPVSVLTVS